MSADQAIDLLTQMLWTAALVGAPVMIVAMVVGLAISVLQVATQLQEMTLSYIPKLAAAGLVLVLAGGWMMATAARFAADALRLIPSLG